MAVAGAELAVAVAVAVAVAIAVAVVVVTVSAAVVVVVVTGRLEQCGGSRNTERCFHDDERCRSARPRFAPPRGRSLDLLRGNNWWEFFFTIRTAPATRS